MTELTKEQLIEEAKLKIAIAKCHPNSGLARVEGELFKIALASLEAEPVGEFYEYKPGDWYQRSVGDKAPKWVPLYAAPPASGNQVSELTMWVKRLVSQLKKAWPDCKLPEKAMDYLKRNELISAEDVLR
ncbi:hypothetical protein V6A17_004738 [Escherichia coli]|uniref:hypothetical protein n=1 Tax=Escherichia coli TaxID=562 RepID=UPI0008474E4F|nr:hypothetical protein [Escherichia coli]AOM53799.1 hypothetical protein BCV59_04335 [Escherichia coli]EES9514428.1 hypothetical protein [Escherichia coli]EET9103497.1 hypothetical protein [Escherichia coli]EFB6639400.1 hypothetical protein [Escherichia coli]EFC2598831.1 hypothetical protein [Escherichia coli]